MNLTLMYDSGLWNYTMTGLDRNGDELDPAVTDFGSLRLQKQVLLFLVLKLIFLK